MLKSIIYRGLETASVETNLAVTERPEYCVLPFDEMLCEMLCCCSLAPSDVGCRSLSLAVPLPAFASTIDAYKHHLQRPRALICAGLSKSGGNRAN